MGGAANKLEDESVNGQNKGLWNWWNMDEGLSEKHEHISCEESLGLTEILSYPRQKLISNELTFPHFNPWLDSPCTMFSECHVMSCCLMLRIFTYYLYSCICANEFLSVHYFEAVFHPVVLSSYTFRLCDPFNNNKIHVFFFFLFFYKYFAGGCSC